MYFAQPNKNDNFIVRLIMPNHKGNKLAVDLNEFTLTHYKPIAIRIYL